MIVHSCSAYAESSDPEVVQHLVVVRKQQYVFAPAIEQYLKLITYGDDGYPEVVRLPIYTQAEVVVDPRRSFGQPIFAHGGVRVADVVDRFLAGESIHHVAQEFGVRTAEIEDVIRAAFRRAA